MVFNIFRNIFNKLATIKRECIKYQIWYLQAIKYCRFLFRTPLEITQIDQDKFLAGFTTLFRRTPIYSPCLEAAIRSTMYQSGCEDSEFLKWKTILIAAFQSCNNCLIFRTPHGLIANFSFPSHRHDSSGLHQL